MKKKNVILFLIICCFCMSLTCTKFVSADNIERINVKYLKTSDGDTARFEIDGENERVRFLGINTPEVSGENKVEEPYGNEALAYTKNKLENAKKIEIEYDDVADKEDRFGRKLAWIWVDDKLYEVEILEQGLAKTYMLKDDYKYASLLKEAENKAKKEKVGIWADNESQNIQDKVNNSTSDQFEYDVQNENIGEYENNSTNEYSWIVILIILLLGLLFKKMSNK